MRTRVDFILFVDGSTIGGGPDHLTVCRFRIVLVDENLLGAILDEVNRQLVELDLKVKFGSIAVVDAMIVKSAARPGRRVENVAEDRHEEDAEGMQSIVAVPRVSPLADSDAAWFRKGRQTPFRLQGVRADRRRGV